MGMRAVALLLVCAVVGRAAEATPEAKAAAADLKAQVKALYADAQGRNDLWTAIQLEAWAAPQHQPLRGAPILGASEIYGDPLLACPDDIHLLLDRGDSIAVLSTKRCHLFAPDGRPLSCSVPFGVRCDRGDIGFSGAWAAAVELDRPEDRPMAWQARSVPIGKGVDGAGVQADFEEPPPLSLGDDELRVADDGSAIAVPFTRDGDPRVVVTTGKGKRVDYNGLVSPIGVAPGGAWLLATHPQDDRMAPVLAAGADRQLLRSAAMGPAMAAIITTENAAQLIDRGGKRTPLTLPMALGAEPRVATVGRWLVVSSGGGAKSLPTTDFLGNELPDAPPQPDTLALFRWDDLVADPKAAAVARFQSPLETSRIGAAAIYLWRGQQLDLLDLSTRAPAARPLYAAPKEIQWAWSRRFWTRVNFKGGGVAIIDDQGRELWSGDGEPEVWSRDFGSVWRGKGADSTYELVHLAADPKERKVVKLDLGGGQWDLSCDLIRERWVARLHDQRPIQWQMGDLTGAVLGRGQGRRTIPDYGTGWPPIGRYLFRYGRIYPKDGGEDPGVPAHLNPQDAWMMGRMLFVLDRDSRVLLTGHKKAGVWSDLGAVDGAAHFGLLGKEELVVANWDPRVVGTFGAGPGGAPAVKPEKPTRPCDPLPEGPWRITPDQQQFASPRGGGMLEFSEERAGFDARWLRSPKTEPANLLMVTASVVVGLDPNVAKMVATTKR